MNRLRRAWSGTWFWIRYPHTQKSARINVGVWAFALATVVAIAGLDVVTQQWGWLIWQGVVGGFDFIMLHRSIEGLLWRRSLDKWLQEKIKQG
jgi:hypothetical protein